MAKQRYGHQVIIQTPTEAQNSYGDVTETWATLLTVWASMESLTAGEKFEAGSTVQENTFIFETYYSSSVTTQHRIKYGTRYFDIEGIENVENRSRKMRIRATETQEAPAETEVVEGD